MGAVVGLVPEGSICRRLWGKLKSYYKRSFNKPVGKSNRISNKLAPDPEALGDHSSFARDKEGNIFKYQEFTENPRNPKGFDAGKRFDGGKPDGTHGSAHTNKISGEDVPTPHVQGKDIPGRVRPARPDEIPKNKRYK